MRTAVGATMRVGRSYGPVAAPDSITMSSIDRGAAATAGRVLGPKSFFYKIGSGRNNSAPGVLSGFGALNLPPSPSALLAPRRPSLRGAFFRLFQRCSLCVPRGVIFRVCWPRSFLQRPWNELKREPARQCPQEGRQTPMLARPDLQSQAQPYRQRVHLSLLESSCGSSHVGFADFTRLLPHFAERRVG
jgi:hypothetical protein